MRDSTRVSAWSRAPGAVCPACGTVSAGVHGRYQRRLVDLAVSGRQVELRLTIRRFRCRDPSCAAVTFAEQVEGLTRAYGRFTELARAALTEVGDREKPWECLVCPFCQCWVSVGSGPDCVEGLVGVEDCFAEQVEVGSSIHLAWKHRDAVDVALHSPGTPGKGQAASDGVMVGPQAAREPHQRGQGRRHWPRRPRCRAAPHADRSSSRRTRGRARRGRRSPGSG
jgi:hypothetical protein